MVGSFRPFCQPFGCRLNCFQPQDFRANYAGLWRGKELASRLCLHASVYTALMFLRRLLLPMLSYCLRPLYVEIRDSLYAGIRFMRDIPALYVHYPCAYRRGIPANASE